MVPPQLQPQLPLEDNDNNNRVGRRQHEGLVAPLPVASALAASTTEMIAVAQGTNSSNSISGAIQGRDLEKNARTRNQLRGRGKLSTSSLALVLLLRPPPQFASSAVPSTYPAAATTTTTRLQQQRQRRRRPAFGLPHRLARRGDDESPWTTIVGDIRGGASDQIAEEGGDDEEEEEDEEEEDDDEFKAEEDESDDDDDSKNPLSSVVSMEPVPVVIRTGVGNDIVDTRLELTAHPSRNVASLKTSVRRQVPGKPPQACQVLRFHNRVLDDELLVDELLEELEDDEDEEEEDEDSASSSEKRRTLVLQLDMIPPVDPKFVAPLQQKIDDREMTVSQLLDAYAANEAALYQNAAELLREQQEYEQTRQMAPDEATSEADEEQEGEISPAPAAASATPAVSVSYQIRQNAARIRRDLEKQLLTADDAKALLAEERQEEEGEGVNAEGKGRRGKHHAPNLQERQVRGQRVRQTAQGGVRTTVKRAVQRNLNVNWSDTVRHFALFLFFGYFGGRTPTSRAILLLGAPSVFLIQARPIKLWLRQFLYAVTDQPPSIFLSLLPAPRQAILSLNVRDAMKSLYGDYIVGADSTSVGTDDSERDVYEDEHASEDEYDDEDESEEGDSEDNESEDE